jgi:hypothetical protein
LNIVVSTLSTTASLVIIALILTPHHEIPIADERSASSASRCCGVDFEIPIENPFDPSTIALANLTSTVKRVFVLDSRIWQDATRAPHLALGK